MVISLKKDLAVLLLLGVANISPIVARHLFKERFSLPVDFNKSFFDKRPILGTHKTWRGLFSSLLVTSLAGPMFGIRTEVAFWLAFWSMLGDLTSSFIKRRLALKSGARCVGVDQIIEALLPVLIMRKTLSISWLDCILIVLLFTFFDIVLSPILYRVGFRRNPH